jgi:hypothetical protein
MTEPKNDQEKCEVSFISGRAAAAARAELHFIYKATKFHLYKLPDP